MAPVGIKQWFRRRGHDVPIKPADYDQDLQADRAKALASREEAQKQVAEVRRLKPQSERVHSGLTNFREDNHFSDWLFKPFEERP